MNVIFEEIVKEKQIQNIRSTYEYVNFKIMCESMQEHLQEISTREKEQNIPRWWEFLQKL